MPTLVVKRSKLRWLEKRGISKSVGKEANYDVSSSDHEFFHVASCNDDGKPLPNVVFSVNEDSDNEVEDVINEHAGFMASKGLKSGNDSGYGINSLLEQCRIEIIEVENMVDEHVVFMASTSLKNGNDSGYGINNLLEQCRSTKQDDDYDPYDDDLYEIHDMFENLRLFVVILISRSMVGRRNRLILMFFESIVI
ncbi:hypothetical protein Tco_0296575 [Tanacetum coccineum]